MSGNARNPAQVLSEMLAIGPQGDGMPTTADTQYAAMLAPIGNELSLVEAAMLSFANEISPLTASNLLADYERVLGPDPYARDTGTLSIGQRQQLAYTRWVGKFGVRPADFVALAATFGVTISIEQYSLTVVGAFAGDFLTSNPEQFAWLAILPTAQIESAEASSSQAGDLQSAFAPSLVQPVLQARAPAHTTPHFSYTG